MEIRALLCRDECLPGVDGGQMGHAKQGHVGGVDDCCVGQLDLVAIGLCAFVNAVTIEFEKMVGTQPDSVGLWAHESGLLSSFTLWLLEFNTHSWQIRSTL